MHNSNPCHQLSTLSDIICYFRCIYWLVFRTITVKVKSSTKWSLKRLKLGKVSSFHPHSMCKKVERVTAKTGCTSCTNWTISFEVSEFQTKTHLLHRLFNILITYLNSGLLLCSVCSIQSDVINFQHVLTSFVVFRSFT